MKVISSASELSLALANYREDQIALVPTMGCLHDGHLSLIRQAKRLADIVVVSIYVNPLQFGVNEDFDSYPQPFAEDAKLCELEGVDFLFHPQNLYPAEGIQIGLHVNEMANVLCGASRPGHFDGVVTVVNILFNIVRPDIAIFGEKDFQQLSIIRRMVSDLYMPIDVLSGDTIREEDGLAKSSRNRYLSPAERQQAAELSTCLQIIIDAVGNGAEISSAIAAGEQYLAQHHITTDYLGIYSEKSLHPVTSLETSDPMRVFIAARIGSARLIDNMPLPFIAQKDSLLCD